MLCPMVTRSRQLHPSHFNPETFLGTVPGTDACHWSITQIVDHSLAASMMVCQFLLERLAMWLSGHTHHSTTGRPLLRQFELSSALDFTARSIGFCLRWSADARLCSWSARSSPTISRAIPR